MDTTPTTTPRDWRTLRNTFRTTPWNMDDRAIAHEVDNLQMLRALKVANPADLARLADLGDEIARRDAERAL